MTDEEKGAPAGPAPSGGSSGPKTGQGAKGKDTQTDSDRCNSGKGSTGNTEHGANDIGGILITKNTAERLNCAEVSGETGGLFLFPKGALTHHPKRSQLNKDRRKIER